MGAEEEHDWLPPTARPALEEIDRALYGLTAAERRLRWRYQQTRQPLSRARIRALLLIAIEHEATPGQLAREAEVNPATITAMIDELDAQGVVQRRRDDHDGRVWWISLTEQGRTELAGVMGRWYERLSETFADMSDAQLEGAAEVLDRLTAAFDAVVISEPGP